MMTIRAVVRNGRIETEEPLNLPEGTRLLIPLENPASQDDESDWDNSPEAIAEWLEWYSSLQPLIGLEESLQDCQQFEKQHRQAHWEKSNKDIEELFP